MHLLHTGHVERIAGAGYKDIGVGNMAKSKKTVTKEDLRQRIDDEFRRWDHIHLHGCSDPGWEDGININLVRNHIIYYYRQMAEIMDGIQMSLLAEAGFEPEQYGMRPIPPEFPMDWMCQTGDYPDRLNGRRK